MNVKDRVAIVTGSGQGIGEGIARVLAAAGARVVLNDLVPGRVAEVVTDFEAPGYEAMGHAATGTIRDGDESRGGGAGAMTGRKSIP